MLRDNIQIRLKHINGKCGVNMICKCMIKSSLHLYHHFSILKLTDIITVCSNKLKIKPIHIDKKLNFMFIVGKIFTPLD